jgi:hypothetical protein
MVEKRDKSPASGAAAERAERERRLAQALRDNLRRRKEQARNKAAGPETPPEHNEKPDKSRGSG